MSSLPKILSDVVKEAVSALINRISLTDNQNALAAETTPKFIAELKTLIDPLRTLTNPADLSSALEYLAQDLKEFRKQKRIELLETRASDAFVDSVDNFFEDISSHLIFLIKTSTLDDERILEHWASIVDAAEEAIASESAEEGSSREHGSTPSSASTTAGAISKAEPSTENTSSPRVKSNAPSTDIASVKENSSAPPIPNFFDDVITKIGSAQLQGHDGRIPSHELNVALKLLEKRKSYRVKHVMNPSEASAFRLNAANVYLQEAQAFYSNHSNGEGLFGLYGEVFRKIKLLIPHNPFLNLTEKYLPTALNNDNSLHGAFISELQTLIELARKNTAMMEHATDFINHYHPNNAVLSEKETSLYLVHHHVCKELISTFPTVMADYYFDDNSSLDESIKSSETIASPDSTGSESPEGVVESKGDGDTSPIRKHTQSENLSSTKSMSAPSIFLNIRPLDLPRAAPLTNENVRDIGQRKLPPGGVLPPLPQAAFALARLKREIDPSKPAAHTSRNAHDMGGQ